MTDGGFQVWNKDGALVIDASVFNMKFIGRVNIGPNDAGSITVAEWATYSPVYFVNNSNAVATSYQPKFTLSGNTLSWVPDPSPYIDSRQPVILEYGYI
jgi:hypothetical protein